jgi:hypothetical protein
LQTNQANSVDIVAGDLLHVETGAYALETKAYALKAKAYALKAKAYALETKAYALKTKAYALKAKAYALETKAYALKSNFSICFAPTDNDDACRPAAAGNERPPLPTVSERNRTIPLFHS